METPNWMLWIHKHTLIFFNGLTFQQCIKTICSQASFTIRIQKMRVAIAAAWFWGNVYDEKDEQKTRIKFALLWTSLFAPHKTIKKYFFGFIWVVWIGKLDQIVKYQISFWWIELYYLNNTLKLIITQTKRRLRFQWMFSYIIIFLVNRIKYNIFVKINYYT